MSHFTDEESVKKLFWHQGNNDSITEYIEPTTLLALIAQLKDWSNLFGSQHWYISQEGYDINPTALIKSVPQGFLELIHIRDNEEEIDKLYHTIISLIEDSRTLPDTVFPVALKLFKIHKKREMESRSRNRIQIHSSIDKNSMSDGILAILATRFPQRYIQMLETLRVENESEAEAKNPNHCVLSDEELFSTL